MRPATALLSLLLAAPPSLPALAGEVSPQRLVQFRSLDLTDRVIEVHNFGDAAMPLDGWRFCSHSNAQVRRYTLAAALNGVSLGAGESMFIYMNNDAPAGSLNFNASTLGAFANNFGQGPYALQLFWPDGGAINFSSLTDLVDHIQWSVNGLNNTVADERSQQAVNAGLWTAALDWIPTTGNSLAVDLVPEGGLLHGPADYTVDEPALNCNAADIALPFGVLDLADISAFVGAFTTGGAAADLAPPAGVLDLADIAAFVSAFTAGCP